MIHGNAGQDDITGGHNVLHGEDGDDTIHGGEDEDVVIGDNGRILREGVPGKTFPWASDIIWVTFPSPFESEAIREIRLFDDIDMIMVRDGSGVLVLCGWSVLHCIFAIYQ